MIEIEQEDQTMDNAIRHSTELSGRRRRLFDLLRTGEFATTPLDTETPQDTAPLPKARTAATDARIQAPADLTHLQFLASESLIFRDR
ncbi:hypothetical protein [Pseudooceanicola onchidii]|uniref:hypothetical protein n=1 Tax=Pseudooceanicola onchidii TaxID=2562279 RepID=UPI0010AB1254|nr:hypothetical protein [Pseudooceanicola onchidii]